MNPPVTSGITSQLASNVSQCYEFVTGFMNSWLIHIILGRLSVVYIPYMITPHNFVIIWVRLYTLSIINVTNCCELRPSLVPIMTCHLLDADPSSEPTLPLRERFMGQHGVHLGPTGPRWAPCLPHEPRYLGASNAPLVRNIIIL